MPPPSNSETNQNAMFRRTVQNQIIRVLSSNSIVLLALSAVCLTVGVNWIWSSFIKPPTSSNVEISHWLDENQLGPHATLFLKAGVTSLSDCASLSVQDESHFTKLDKEDVNHIQSTVLKLRRKIIFEHWIKEAKLTKYISRLFEHGVASAVQMSRVSDEFIATLTHRDRSSTDYIHMKSEIMKLRESLLKGKDYESVETLQRLATKKWGFVNISLLTIFLVSILAIGYVLIYMYIEKINYRVQNATKDGIFKYLRRYYGRSYSCRVCWEQCEQPETVGKTVNFQIKLFDRLKGNPRPLKSEKSPILLIEVVHSGIKVTTVTEYGSSEDSHIARVSFTVHKAGDYNISVLVDTKHIHGSPFKKSFEAGPIDASKSGFMHYNSMVVCTQGSSHSLIIETRDSYGNLASYNVDQRDYFKIKVTKAGTKIRYNASTQILCDPASKLLTMHIKMDDVGAYYAHVTYGGTKLKNGDFTIIVLTGEEAAHVHKVVARKGHNVWYETRLLSANHETREKPKKLYAYISPKQLTLKEFYLKIIGKTLYTFRVCPSTKFTFNSENNQSLSGPVFTIDDGCQAPVVIAAKDRNIVVATFTSFLLQNIGGSETFQDKQAFFYHEIRQLHSKRKHTALPLKITRYTVLKHSYKATKNLMTDEWCRNFEIAFQGEPGLDWGGVRREWFEILCVKLFDPTASGLFMRFTDSTQALVHPNPRRSTDLKMKYYEFAGKIVGKCLYESSLGRTYRQNIKARFSRSFLAQLIGLRVNYRYFESDDPELYKSKIQYIEENSIDDMELYFAEEEYDENGKLVRVIELVPNGSKIPVTNQNKLHYLNLLAQHRLAGCVKEEVESFLKGLNELIPDNLLSIFDENELELLMCGTSQYSIADFKLHHSVSGNTANFTKVLGWFWTTVTSFTEEQMARLLQFVTGSSLLPPGGFIELSPHIQLTPTLTFGALPLAHTCFNQLCLPDYDNLEQFHKALLLAINEGSQGFSMA